MAFDVRTTTINIGDVGGDNRQVTLLKAPAAAHGGGLRILAVDAIHVSTLALSAGVGGTSFTGVLHRYSNAGTPLVNGTVSTNTVGGTAVGWTAGVVQPFVLNDAYTYLSAGERLVWQYNELNSANPIQCQVSVTWMQGK
jgi:hypothetical protein